MNLDKLDAAIAYIEKNPAQHKQSYWFTKSDGGCGTAFCLAGAIVLLDGWQPVWGGHEVDLANEASVCEKDGAVEDVQETAIEILDPSDDQHDKVGEMFSAFNNLDQIRRLRDELATSGEAGERSDTQNDLQESS